MATGFQDRFQLRLPREAEILADPATVRLEWPSFAVRARAELVADLSGQTIDHGLLDDAMWHTHGSYHRPVHDALLFAQHHMHGVLSHGTRFDTQMIDDYPAALRLHVAVHPGRHLPIPQIYAEADGFLADMAQVPDAAVTQIDRPSYLALPIEPGNWGAWLQMTIPAAHDFVHMRPAERFLCVAHAPWQQDFLRLLGVADDAVVNVTLARSFRCTELVMRHFSHRDIAVSVREHAIFADLARRVAAAGRSPGYSPAGRRVFISRRVASRQPGTQRVLLNEDALIARMQAAGFDIVDPETHPIADQIRIFHHADLVVGLGGAGLFTAIFCRPGTRILSIESSSNFSHNHAALFSSLGLPYGVIFGRQDANDPEPIHKRWTLDIDRAMAAVAAF